MSGKRLDLFKHDEKARPKEVYHILPYEGTPHPVREGHKEKKKR